MAGQSERKPKPTFQREDRDEFRTTLSILIARVLSIIVLLLPQRLRYQLAHLAGMISYRTSHGYRDNVESNIRHVTGLPQDHPQVQDTARSIFLANALNFTDLLTMTWRSSRWLARHTLLPAGGWDVIDNERGKGQGVIFVSAHVGCFDFIGQSFQARGYPLTVVTGRTTSRFVFDGVTWLRGRRGSRMVEPTPSGVRQAIKALRRNECVVIVSDRDFFENGQRVEFFGHPTTLPPGVVRIARDTGAPIVPVFTRRTGTDHEVHIMPPMHIAKTNDVKADVERGMRQLVPVLELGISECLHQWVMFQRVWPEQSPDVIKVFPTGSPLESPLLEKVAQVLPERKPGDSTLSGE